MKKPLLVKVIKRTVYSLLILLMLLATTYWLLKDNIHTVIPNQIYRSAQLGSSEFKKIIREKNIHSIINLRGKNVDNDWYRKEIAVSKELGVKHYDFALKATKLPTRQQLLDLINLLETAPEPVLIHCEGGADRTGLASALVLLLRGKTLPEANQEISFFYLAISNKSVGRLVLPIYASWLNQNHLSSTRDNLLKWAKVAALPIKRPR
jgi:protein tyrosine phosphatase (PTP) superfamily phosphohydrolase (DUF442 family)